MLCEYGLLVEFDACDEQRGYLFVTELCGAERLTTFAKQKQPSAFTANSDAR
jgi:hypothetical protein